MKNNPLFKSVLCLNLIILLGACAPNQAVQLPSDWISHGIATEPQQRDAVATDSQSSDEAQVCDVELENELEEAPLENSVARKARGTCRAATAFCQNLPSAAMGTVNQALLRSTEAAHQAVACVYSGSDQLIHAVLESKKTATDVLGMGTRIVRYPFNRLAQWLSNASEPASEPAGESSEISSPVSLDGSMN